MDNDAATLDIRLRDHDLVLDGPGDVALRLDDSGRWCRFRHGHRRYRRYLSGHVAREEIDGVTRLSPELARSVHREVGETLMAVDSALQNGQVQPRWHGNGASSEQVIERLSRAHGWNPDLLEEQILRFDRVYPEHVPILPPDRYRDVVVLPATGCPHARCQFCAFYRDRPFQRLSDEQFRNHLQGIQSLFGRGLFHRHGAFLGSASALSLSQQTLRARLSAVRDLLGDLKRGVASFLDAHHAPIRSQNDYRQLASLGLSLVVLGLETACGELRASLGKSRDLAVLNREVNLLREAGIGVGITILVGAGGLEWARRHVDETCRWLEKQKWHFQDHIYLSPWTKALPQEALMAQMEAFKSRLRSHLQARIVPYQMQRFGYFT